MKTSTSTLGIALAGLLLLGSGACFAQGVYETPPAPNSNESMPQPPDSAPLSARTVAPGSTGQQRIGTFGTTNVDPAPAVPAKPVLRNTVVAR